jgi:hypothetical protein
VLWNGRGCYHPKLGSPQPGGFAASYGETVLDELYAKAAVFSSDSLTLATVVLDVIQVSGAMAQIIREKYWLPMKKPSR